jgi:DNA-binding winged helix-turn-helix (wHTH) protein/Flp pilus assembly protein TadD/TolB-like protein
MVFIDRRKSQQFHIDPKLRKGFKLADAVILPNDGEVVTHGERCHLPPKAMEILLFLSQHHNQPITTEQLLLVGWGYEKTKRSNLTHVISQIRHALDDHKECPEYIQTLPRKGYRLIAKVERLDENILYPGVWPIKRSPTTQLAEGEPKQHRWHLSLSLQKNSKLLRVSAAFVLSTWVLLQVLELLFPIFGVPDWGLKIAVLVLVIGFPLALLFTWLKEIKIRKHLFAKDKEGRRNKHFFKQLAFDFSFIGVLSISVGFLALYLIEAIEVEQSDTPDFKTQVMLNIPIRDNLVAVLPFQFEESVPLPEYIKSTFQAEIINALSQQPDFNFVSQRAVNELAAGSQLSDYINRLGARYLLDGNIVAAQGQMNILLNLTDTKNSLQVWSTTIQGNPDRLLAVQKEINRQAFNALALLAQRQPDDHHQVISTSDFKAYDSYIQGKNRLASATIEEELLTAERHFLNSLNYDPQFTLASAGLCQTYLDQYELTQQVAVFQLAKQRCSALLAFFYLKQEAFVALGNLNRIGGKHLIAIDYYQKALSLSDDNLDAITGTALSNNALGNVQSAEKLLLKAIQLEPGYWKNYLSLGDLLFKNGKYREATEQYARVTLLRPNDEQGFNRLGASFYLDDQIEPASTAWRRSLDIRPSALNYSNLGTALFLRGQFAMAEQNYQKSTALKVSDPVLWGNLADAQKFGESPDTANSSYQTALKLVGEQLLINPYDQTLLGMQARYQSELEQCSAAVNTSSELLGKKNADPYLYYDLSIVAINCGQLTMARQLINDAIRLGYSEKLLARDIQFAVIIDIKRPQQ